MKSEFVNAENTAIKKGNWRFTAKIFKRRKRHNTLILFVLVHNSSKQTAIYRQNGTKVM